MASVQTNGITIEYEVEGDGDPLLLVMGLSGQLIDWPREFVDALLARGFQVIRHDNRDAGLSTAFDTTPPSIGQIARAAVFRRSLEAPYRVDDMAADAAGLLDQLGIARAHVTGVSMGGMIAQAMAVGHADRVASLTSIMSTTGNRWVGRPKSRLIRKMARRPVPTPETAVDAAIETFAEICGPTFDPVVFRPMAEASVARSFRPDGTARQMAAILASADRTEALRGVDVPALVVHGLLDPLVQPSGGIATAKAIPSSRLLMFNDMAHDLPSTRWTEIADAIRLNADRAGQRFRATSTS